MEVVIYTFYNISIMEGLKVEFNKFNRLWVYSNNGAGRCQWHSCTDYGGTQGKI